MEKPKAIVLDDDPDITEVESAVLEAIGFECDAHNHFSSFKESSLDTFDLVILDLAMPGRDGLEVIDYLAEQSIKMPVLLISGMPDGVLRSAESVARQRGLNVAGWMRKPFWPEELGKRIEAITSTPDTHLFSNDEIEELLDQRGGLVVEYLPKVNIQWYRFDGLEALARLRHPQHGLVQATDFVPQLARSEIKLKLTKKLILRVLSDMRGWLDWDIEPKVAINLDLQSLADRNLVDWLGRMAGEFSIPLDRFRVEVGDLLPALITPDSLSGMTRLRIKEARVSMGGINGAAPSENFLRSLPIDEIKLDRSLVARFESEREAEKVAEQIVAVAKKLRLQSVAEGVESAEQLKVIEALGFDVAQGFFFSKPLGAVQVPALLSTKPRAY